MGFDVEDFYSNCLNEMYSLRRFGIKLGLDVISNILNGLGNPQKKFLCIHVAGTNGKGSIASFLSSILHSSGYKVGLYTSPHLVNFNERICINDRPVSDESVVKSYEAVKSVYSGDREPTFFEFATAMALYEFGREDVDWAVIETGMGGRLDATNIIKPAVSIISNISVEHKMYLGNTIAQIAGEKGGIIKEDVPVVTGVRQKTAISVLKGLASKKGSSFYRLGKDFYVRRGKNGRFTYFGIDNIWRNIQTSLIGKHQADNAAQVLATCEILDKNMANLPIENIRKGLMQTSWPGRLEIVSSSPVILLDGAHNFVAARKLADYLSENFNDRKITLVIGILDDKPYGDILKTLLPLCNRVILTRSEIDRALPPEKLYPVACGITKNVKIINEVKSALAHAVETASPDEAVCVAGSLYVVGEAKKALHGLSLC